MSIVAVPARETALRESYADVDTCDVAPDDASYPRESVVSYPRCGVSYGPPTDFALRASYATIDVALRVSNALLDIPVRMPLLP